MTSTTLAGLDDALISCVSAYHQRGRLVVTWWQILQSDAVADWRETEWQGSGLGGVEMVSDRLTVLVQDGRLVRVQGFYRLGVVGA